MAARIAVNASWAKTPDRQARTRNAIRSSPVSVEYWEARLRAEGVVSEADIPRAAENARKSYMQGLALKSAKSRERNKAAKKAAVRAA